MTRKVREVSHECTARRGRKDMRTYWSTYTLTTSNVDNVYIRLESLHALHAKYMKYHMSATLFTRRNHGQAG